MKQKAARRPQRSSAAWREEIARWRQSGLSASEYAAHYDVGVSSLFAWSKQFRLPTGAPASPKHVSFVPLRVLGAASEADSAPFEFEVTLANGRKVRARGDVDAARFARVLDALEGGSR